MIRALTIPASLGVGVQVGLDVAVTLSGTVRDPDGDTVGVIESEGDAVLVAVVESVAVCAMDGVADQVGVEVAVVVGVSVRDGDQVRVAVIEPVGDQVGV